MTQEITNFFDQSVTRDDFTKITDANGVIKLVVPFWNYRYQGRIIIPPEPPVYYSIDRDIIMRATIHNEAMWAAAVGIAITKVAALAFELKSSVDLRARRAQEILLQADGIQVGWVGFLSKQLRDFLTTDNGAFYEIVRATSSAGSRIVGLRHLDSVRCTRTGDPERPVVFRDRKGYQHLLRDYQVVMLSDMPDPSETYYGVGFCAASRAYNAIYKLAQIEWYLREKVGGLHPLAIHIVNGMLTRQIEDAVKSVEEGQISKGVASYMGAVIIGTPKENPPELVTIPLAELPDRFQRKEEFDISLLTYADCIGMDAQELQPLTGQPLGTGTQSQVLDDKGRGKGLSAWRQGFTHGLNNFVLDELTTFSFIEKDYRDQERSVAISKARADVSTVRIKSQITTPAQELQILVDADDLPREFLEKDVTPGDTVSDTDKPAADDDAKVGAAAADVPKDVAPAQGEKKPAEGEQSPTPAGEIKPTPAASRLTAAQQQTRIDRDRNQAVQQQIAETRAQSAQDRAAAAEEKKKPVAKSTAKKKEGDNKTWAMVALFLPDDIAEKYALDEPGALPANDLHITLAFLGDDATEQLDRDAVEQAVSNLARENIPITGVINGQGRFQVEYDPETGEGVNAHFLAFDSPNLPAFRQDLVDALAENGIQIDEKHGFTPHITLVYNDSPTPPEVAIENEFVRFPGVTVAWGEDRKGFTFTGKSSTTKASDESMAEANRLLLELLDKPKKNREG